MGFKKNKHINPRDLESLFDTYGNLKDLNESSINYYRYLDELNNCVENNIKFDKKLTERDWFDISMDFFLSDEFIIMFEDKLNWKLLSEYQKLSEKIMHKYNNKLDWKLIFVCQNITKEFINELCFENFVILTDPFTPEHILLKFMEIYTYSINWEDITKYRNLSLDFIRKTKDYIDWNYLSVNMEMSEDFMFEMKDYINWCRASKYQNLSEELILKLINIDDTDAGMSFYSLFRYQKLSEKFLEKYVNDMNKYNVVIKYQDLTDEFKEKLKIIVEEKLKIRYD